MELGTRKKKLAWKIIFERVGLGCVWRAALPCEELPPASTAAGDKEGQSKCTLPLPGIYMGMVGAKGPANTPDLEKKQSVCPEGKVEL